MPKMEFRSNQKASLFAYPPALEEKKKEEHEKVKTIDTTRWQGVSVVFLIEVFTS